jgi:membrane-bound lytic murein transglycosylase D
MANGARASLVKAKGEGGLILLGRLRAFCCLAVALALSACATAEKRRTYTPLPPPASAWSPDPLPIPKPTLALQAAPRLLPDAVTVLIQQAEAFYASGMEDYRAGNFEKARAKFDQAVSVLLESKLDLSADDRLNAEFNKVVEDIHGLEVSGLENSETPPGRREVTAPIDSIANLTFPVDPQVKERAQLELQAVQSDLPLVSNDYVDGVLTYFQGRGRGFIERILKRLGAYQPIFSDALRQQGLPQDLVYLAASESAFNPFAVSKARCVGIWQFSLGTGTMYGLKKNRWVDEREDPVKSTDAAARHLKDLYNTFGDWYLAMAAYDSGPLTVQRAIEKTGYVDYWKLRSLHALPRETENYVPIFLATALIGKDPKTYGFDVAPDPPLDVDQMVVTEPTDLRLIAQLIDRPVDELIQLNPSLLRWTTPANDPEFKLNLPAGAGEVFQKAVAAIPTNKRIWWRSYKVEGSETMATIAKKYRISTVALAEANGIDRDAELEAGARLVLPLAPGNESSLQRVRDRGPRRAVAYRVRSGDTLELVADRFDVTPYQIRQWNHLGTSSLLPGKTLKVYVAGGGSKPRHSQHRTGPAQKSVAKKKTPTRRNPNAARQPKAAAQSAALSAKAGQ